MTEFLVRKFVKQYENTESPRVREGYGTLSSIVGIVCNIFLFLLKYVIGSVSASISIISDAFNNLSDSAGCIVTLIGCRLAAKPADRDHPFGHGRAEYITSLVISALIMFMGFELLRSSAGKIAEPEEVRFSMAAAAALAASIGLKLWMSVFNGKLGKRIDSPVLLAASADSRNDVIATGAAFIGLTASLFTELPVDGAMGVIVSMFVIKAGFGIMKDTVDDLLGKPIDRRLADSVAEIICSDEKITGIHDLLIHNYGPGKMIASCHAELDCSESFISAHDAADKAERRIYDRLGILMTIHTDPVDPQNLQTMALKEVIEHRIAGIDPGMKIHDFRTSPGNGCTVLIFDAVVPYDCALSDEEILAKISAFSEFSGDPPVYVPVVTLDRSFTDEE